MGYLGKKPDNARQLRGIFIIEPNDEKFKHTMKNVRMPAAMPCKTIANCLGETCSSIGKHKTKYACIVDADESMRIRLEGVPHRYHEDHITAKGGEFIESLQSCAQVYSDASSNKRTGCEGSSGEKMGKSKENTGMAADESPKQSKKLPKKQGIRATNLILRRSWISVTSRIQRQNRSIRSTKVELCSEAIL